MDGSDAHPAPWPPPLLSLAEFDVAAIDSVTATLHTVDAWNLSSAFSGAQGASRSDPATQQTAFRLLEGATSIVLRPQDKVNPWGARWTDGGGRSPLPEDFAGAQNGVLAQLAERLAHPGLKARLADIAWTNDRKQGAAAATAIEAYCDCAERIVDGRSRGQFDNAGGAMLEALGYVERALYLARRTRRGGVQPHRVVGALQSIYDKALNGAMYHVFDAAARCQLYYELVDAKAVANDAEALAVKADPQSYALVVKDVWDLAAQLHAEAGDGEAEQRCRLGAVDRILAMRSQVSGAGAEAHWVQTALFALRHIPGTETQRRTLRQELRDLQEDSLSEFGRIAIPMDFGTERDAELNAFDNLDLADALKQLACIARSQPIDDLRQQALSGLEVAPLSAMMSIKYSDADGKTAAQSPGAPAADTPDEAWFKATINRNETIRRQIILVARFEPARLSITSRYDVGERHLAPIVAQSPFVRQEQTPLMTLGFMRLLEGDYRSAVHLLVPQLEPCLRYLLRLAGHDPAIEFDDMTEEDIGLPAMLGRFRPQLEAILPPAVVLELDLLFHHRPGSALRHTLAHGLIGAGGCFSIDAVYACWLLYQLTAWPLLGAWDERVGPAIRMA